MASDILDKLKDRHRDGLSSSVDAEVADEAIVEIERLRASNKEHVDLIESLESLLSNKFDEDTKAERHDTFLDAAKMATEAAHETPPERGVFHALMDHALELRRAAEGVK